MWSLHSLSGNTCVQILDIFKSTSLLSICGTICNVTNEFFVFVFFFHPDARTNHVLSCRWRIVVHGGIDGYSCIPVYLHASDNNQASTVLRLFLEAGMSLWQC